MKEFWCWNTYLWRLKGRRVQAIKVNKTLFTAWRSQPWNIILFLFYHINWYLLRNVWQLCMPSLIYAKNVERSSNYTVFQSYSCYGSTFSLFWISFTHVHVCTNLRQLLLRRIILVFAYFSAAIMLFTKVKLDSSVHNTVTNELCKMFVLR